MVGDCNDVQAVRFCFADDLFDRMGAIRERRVHMGIGSQPHASAGPGIPANDRGTMDLDRPVLSAATDLQDQRGHKDHAHPDHLTPPVHWLGSSRYRNAEASVSMGSSIQRVAAPTMTCKSCVAARKSTLASLTPHAETRNRGRLDP